MNFERHKSPKDSMKIGMSSYSTTKIFSFFLIERRDREVKEIYLYKDLMYIGVTENGVKTIYEKYSDIPIVQPKLFNLDPIETHRELEKIQKRKNHYKLDEYGFKSDSDNIVEFGLTYDLSSFKGKYVQFEEKFYLIPND